MGNEKEILEWLKREYKKELVLIKECYNCNGVTSHRFVDLEDTEYNKLICLNCEHIGYKIKRADFNLFYDEQKIGIEDLNLLINCEHPFHIINCSHCEKYEKCAKENWERLSEMDKNIFYK